MESWRFVVELAGRTVVRDAPVGAGFAVRRDWPDRSHDLVHFRTLRVVAERRMPAEANYWRRCHYKPSLSIVEVSPNDFESHRGRRDCQAPDCPTPLPDTDAARASGVGS